MSEKRYVGDRTKEIGDAVLTLLGISDMNVTKFSLHVNFREFAILELERVCDEPPNEGMRLTTKYRLVPED